MTVRARFSLILALVALVALALLAPAPAAARALFQNSATEQELLRKLGAIPEGKGRSTRLKLLIDLGTLRYKNGQMAEAAEAFEEALPLGPSRSERKHLYLYLGKSYESSGRSDKAINAYEQVAELDEKNWRRHRDLAVLYEQVLLYPQAIDQYNRAVQLQPREGSLYAALARMWRKSSLYERADVQIKKADSMGYDHVAVRCEESHIYEGQGRFSDAAGAWNECISPSSPTEQWGKLVYLAALGGNSALAQSGVDHLKQTKASTETIEFYADLAHLSREKPARVAEGEIHNRRMKTMFDKVLGTDVVPGGDEVQ